MTQTATPPTTAVATTSATTTWKIDPAHSAAEFKVKHMMISYVRGKFSGISGVLHRYEADHTRSTLEVSIDTSTLNTLDAQRDGHLKGADFLHVENFPAMTFKSTRIERKGDGYAVTGDLTIRGVTRPVTLTVEEVSEPAKDPWGNTRIGLTATAKINRKDFGLTWNTTLETGGVLVGEDVGITLDVQLVKAA
ncbi:YceI [Candidatus Sulfotelmatomonas gaucii]|uniref:YceI n=1 Tax=Candidatus Sulfuritelmatomonas gaucii TaxID=2043161 RepID=A0A2N9LA71_9BACT|nr:YceI [Candidatus Sulfotelmatomonas gaucii]